uniref:Uncharacterized protein n=1 Tax=Arundo donax TaxID=35708 RepID=A0A0A8Y8G2_ARUDO
MKSCTSALFTSSWNSSPQSPYRHKMSISTNLIVISM